MVLIAPVGGFVFPGKIYSPDWSKYAIQIIETSLTFTKDYFTAYTPTQPGFNDGNSIPKMMQSETSATIQGIWNVGQKKAMVGSPRIWLMGTQ